MPAFNTQAKLAANGQIQALDAPYPLVLYMDAVRQNFTGDTAEHVVAEAIIPGNLLGLYGQVEIEALMSCNTGVTNKQMRFKFGGQTICTLNTTTNTSNNVRKRISNRGVANAQVAVSTSSIAEFTGGATTPSTYTVDTTADVTVQVTLQLASALDDVHLESCRILVYPTRRFE